MEEIETSTLSSLVRDIFQGSRRQPRDRFQNWIFEKVKPLIPFDSALWGTGVIHDDELVVNSIYLENQPMQMMEDYAPYQEQDILNFCVWKHPGETINLYHLISRCRFESMDIYKKHARKYGMEQIISTAIRHPASNLLTFISLYRSDYNQPFSEQHRKLKEFIMPLLVDAYNLNLFANLNAPVASHGYVSAICDIKGILLEVEPNFSELMLLEWPEWREPILGFVPEDVLAGKESAYVYGKNITIKLSVQHDLVLLRVRKVSSVDNLTRAEKRVAKLLTTGLCNKGIANELAVSPRTVGHHLHSIYNKLDTANRGGAIALLKDQL